MNLNAILLATITCFSTLLGGIFASRRRKNIGIRGAFAARAAPERSTDINQNHKQKNAKRWTATAESS